MDLLLDYSTDQNNGLSPIFSIDNLPGRAWGQPCMTETRLVVPMIAETNENVIFSYTYSTIASRWVFHQLVHTGVLNTSTTYPRVTVTTTTLSMLDNTTRKCYIYRLDGDQQWALFQTIDVPYTPREIGTAQSGAATNIQLDPTTLGLIDGYYVGWTVTLTGGTGVVGETRTIVFYSATTREAEVDRMWTIIPNNTTTYELQFNSYSMRISAYETRIAISDWAYLNPGGTSFGKVHIYNYNEDEMTYYLEGSVASPDNGDYKYGSAVSLRNGHLFVGVYDKSHIITTNDGAVYIYEYSGGAWPALPDQELVSPGAADYNHFGYSLEGYVETEHNLIVGEPGFNFSTGQAYVYYKSGGTWILANAIDASPPGGWTDEFGSSVCIWSTQAIVSSHEVAGEGAVYFYEFDGMAWNFVSRHSMPGSVGYGYFTGIALNYALVIVYSGDTYLFTWDSAAWTSEDFISLLTTKVKTTVSGSIYHSTDNNTTLTMLLTTPLNGNFQIILELANKIKTIGGNNNAIYFYENGVYKKTTILLGTYTPTQLATAVTNAMNSVGSLTYDVQYIVGLLKFSASANGVFCFGSNEESSYADSMQDKVLGFFNNNNSPLSDYFLADREAVMTAPERIGVKIANCYPASPVRNNNPFNEVGLLANLVSSHYVITREDNQIIRIPRTINTLTFTFPALEGGGLHNVNTNELILRLIKV